MSNVSPLEKGVDSVDTDDPPLASVARGPGCLVDAYQPNTSLDQNRIDINHVEGGL